MDVRTANADHRTAPPAPEAFDGLPVAAAIRGLVAACDIALLVNDRGIIETVTLGATDLADHGVRDWPGQAWADTVLPENRAKIDAMLAGDGDPARWRQVNHPTTGGDVPIRYLAIETGEQGRILAVGRDMRAAAAAQQQRLLRAQQAMERDSLRLRQLEARYRLVVRQRASEAIIVVDSTRPRGESPTSTRRRAA
jgi:hypothetical protein